MLIYLHATNQHPRLNHLGEMNQKPKKGIFTLSHSCVAVLSPHKHIIEYDGVGGCITAYSIVLFDQLNADDLLLLYSMFQGQWS